MNATPLAPNKLHAMLAGGAASGDGPLVLDVREPREFGRGHVPRSVCVPLGNLMGWMPFVLDALGGLPAEGLVLVGDAPEDDPTPATGTGDGIAYAYAALAAQGLAPYVAGYLAGGWDAWEAAGYETATLAHVGARAIEGSVGADARIVDVRRPDEFAAGHVPGSENVPLEEYPAVREALAGETRPVLMVCRVGNRSATAASLVARELGPGKTPPLHNLIGGYTAWRALNSNRT